MRKINVFFVKYYRVIVPLLILIVVCLFLSRGWLNSGFPKGHDAMVSIPISWPLRESLLSNLTMISWNPYWYLGSPAVWRLPQIFEIFVASDKLFSLIVFVFAGIFMYLFTYNITKNSLASFISATFYTFLPYHLLQIFEGALSLSMAYTLTPLVFLLIEKNSESNSRRLTIFAGFTVAALILTAPQTFPILVGPFIFTYCLFKILIQRSSKSGKELTKKALVTFAPLVIGLLLSAYWWFPMIFERNLFSSTTFSLEETRSFTPTLLELITLRPSSCCSPATFGFGADPSIPVLMLRLFVPIFALSALIVVRRNKYVLFFSITGLIAITLGMGVNSPIPIFSFLFENIPLWNGIRTPGRFLMFAGFAFSALAGFTMMRISSWIRKPKINLVVLSIAALFIIAPVYEAAQYAFQTFDLEPSQRNAMSWLSEQSDGRLVSLPWLTWVYDSEKRNIVFPWNYVQLHKKEVVMGGTPSTALQNTVNMLNILRSKIYNERIDSVDLVNILGIKYVVLDRNYSDYFSEEQFNTVCADLESSNNFEKVWSEDNVTIFKNLNAFPRVFLLRENEVKKIDVFEDSSTFVWRCSEGNARAELSWDEETVLTGNRSLRGNYKFTNKGRDWLNIGTRVENIDFENFDAINFWYYLPEAQPNIRLGIAIFENDGGRYTAPIWIDTSQGWHKVSVPFALLRLAYSEDQNRQLDKDQIRSLWIGVTETGSYDENKVFTIYFDNMCLSKYEYVFDGVSFELIHPGEYKVSVNLDEPVYVVLAESYHPQWVAKDLESGKVIAESEPLFVALNGFWLESGKHELIVEYGESLPHKIGTICSILTLLACVGYLLKIHYYLPASLKKLFGALDRGKRGSRMD